MFARLERHEWWERPADPVTWPNYLGKVTHQWRRILPEVLTTVRCEYFVGHLQTFHLD